MKLLRINSYTKVVVNGKDPDEIKAIFNKQSISKSSDFTEPKKPKPHPKDYEGFCKKIFSERHFLTQKEFHKLLAKHFGSNYSYYRKRMIDLGLISVNNKIIKYKNYDYRERYN